MDVLGNTVTTFANSDGSNGFDTVGVKMPIELLSDADDENRDLEAAIPFPNDVLVAEGFDHVHIQFHPEARGVFTEAHWDFLFYLVDEATEQNITCPETRVSPDRIPAGFTIPSVAEGDTGTCVPGEGVHAVATTVPSESIDESVDFIYHGGDLIAIVVSLSKDRIDELGDFDSDIPRPATLPPTLVSWPQKFQVQRDNLDQELRVALTDFR